MTDTQNQNSQNSNPKPKKSGRAARLSAARAVTDVLRGRLPLDQALYEQKQYGEMDSRDKAFARLIASTTLRRTGQINHALSKYIQRDPAPLARAILQTAAAQLMYLGVPAHAVVAETVAVLKRNRDRKVSNAAPMANAVLRRISENKEQLAGEAPLSSNFPDWLRERWERNYGVNAVEAMARVYTQIPPLDLTVKSDPEAWAEKLGGTVLPTGTVRLTGISDVTALEGFDEGQWWVQDIASALPVRQLGDLSGKKALDLCCAPGGKTMQLAHAGADVIAIDKSKARLARTQENLDRTQLKAKLIKADVIKFRGAADHSYDLVLLDAPCTATGTFRRHPEAAQIKRRGQMRELEGLQAEMLDAAARQTKPGGLILYCTCSLQFEEGEDQIQSFLKRSPEFSLISFLNEQTLNFHPYQQRKGAKEGYLRSLPHDLEEFGGMDGFFTACLRRNIHT